MSTRSDLDAGSAVADQVRVLRRRWRVIALVALIAVATSLAYSAAETPRYRAVADVLLAPTNFDVQRSGASISAEEVATQVRIVTSLPVAEKVQETLGLAAPPDLTDRVTVEALGQSRVLRVTASSSDRFEAAELATVVAESYIEYRRQNAQASLAEVTATLTERQQTIEDRIDRLDELLQGTPNTTGELEAERRNLLSQLGQITSQLAGLDISVSTGGGGTLITRPDVPQTPVSPRPVLNGVLALLLGLAAGALLALIRERLDPVLHSEPDLEQALLGIPVVARVHRWKALDDNAQPLTVTHPESRASQAYQGLNTRLRTLLTRWGPEEGGAVVLCTSVTDSDGKSELAANLAVASARVGQRVVLLNADFRRRGGALFDAPVGLSDLLESRDNIKKYLLDGPVPGLLVLPSGAPPEHPTAVLASPAFHTLLRALREHADLVILDTPSSAAFADALEVAPSADVVLLATRLHATEGPMLESVAERALQVCGARAHAVVLDADGRVETLRPVGRRRLEPNKPA